MLSCVSRVALLVQVFGEMVRGAYKFNDMGYEMKGTVSHNQISHIAHRTFRVQLQTSSPALLKIWLTAQSRRVAPTRKRPLKAAFPC